MKNEYSKNKNMTMTLRLSQDEYRYIEKAANQSKMTLSDYVRQRVAEDSFNSVPTNISAHESKISTEVAIERIMPLVVNMFLYSKRMAEKTVGDEVVQDCRALADQFLKDWGYK